MADDRDHRAPLKQAATWYAEHLHWRVFPVHGINDGRCTCGATDCEHPGKHPWTQHGVKDATTDLTQIEKWWSAWPHANIGLATGEPSGVDVLDIDHRTYGRESLWELERQNAELPSTVMSLTGGGGSHAFFQHTAGLKNQTGQIALGLDFKTTGGYVILPPSNHVSGSRYAWEGASRPHEVAIARCPDWLLGLIRNVSTPNGTRKATIPLERIPVGQRNCTLASLAGSMRRRGLAPDEIEACLLRVNENRCDPPLSRTEVRAIAESISRYSPTTSTADPESSTTVEWPDPLPIQGDLPPVKAFSTDLLPRCFRAVVADVAERMQVPADYPAVIMILCLAGVVNRRATVQPKENDTSWEVVPNLWGGIIAPPGFLKSPVIQTCIRPLLQIQTEWRNEYEASLVDYELKKEEFELRRSAWREQCKANVKSNKTAPARPNDPPLEPKLRRLIVNDATFEAMHQTMNENPAGILVIRDELAGWWSQLDRPGREGERAFCLQAWNGDTGHTIDRISRGTVHVAACCMSMLGGIQPGRLRSYLTDALKDCPNNDGLIQRFQLLVWPDTNPKYTYVDRAPNADSEAKVEHVFRRLVEMDAANPAQYRFSPDAQQLFIAFIAGLEGKVRGNELHPALISHLSKYRKLMPALALVFELADRAAAGQIIESASCTEFLYISPEHTQQAVALCNYFESHAVRIFSCVTTPQMRAAQILSEKIKMHRVAAEGSFSCRDVYIKGWSGLDSPELVRLAVDVLLDASWIRPVSQEPGVAGGRPTNRYQVNPKVWE